LNGDTLSPSTVLLDPCQQTTGSAAFLNGDKIREENKPPGGTQRCLSR
jgi:hypothetical protein